MAESEPKEISNIMDELAHSDSVRKLIECPVCLELPLPPIYVCVKGHIVCNSCQARTYSCPLCREHYSTTRGFVAEGIIEQCLLRCKFADHGCPLTMRGSALADHLETCDYRPVICVDCGGKLIDFDGYEEHLLKFHRINGISQSRAYVIYSMNLTHRIHFGEKCCWPQYYLKAFGNTFLLRLYATHWFVCAWLSLLGPKSDCCKYEVILEFHPTSNDTVVHTWQGPVNHFRDDPPKEIYLQGRGLITPLETLMEIAPVANDNAEWLYNIEILEANMDKLESDCDALGSTAGENETETTNSVENSPEASIEEKIPTVSTNKRPTDEEGGPDGPSQTAIVSEVGASGSINSARVVLRVPSSPIYNFSDTPRRMSTPLRTPTPTLNMNSNTNPGSATILSPGPAVLSPSTSTLAAAATVTSVVPTPSSLMENIEASSSAPYSSFGSTSSQGPVSVTTRSTSRLLRRASSLCAFLQGANRSYGLNDEDWICSSASESDGDE